MADSRPVPWRCRDDTRFGAALPANRVDGCRRDSDSEARFVIANIHAGPTCRYYPLLLPGSYEFEVWESHSKFQRRRFSFAIRAGRVIQLD